MSKQDNLANFTALRDALSELDMLTAAPDGGKSREHRVKFLLSKIAALRSGYGIDELNRAQIIASTPDDDPSLTGRSDGTRRQIARDMRRAEGQLTFAQRAEVDYWRNMILGDGIEGRTMQGTGAPVLSSLQGNLGSFVPFEYFREFLPMALKAYDCLFDPDVVTFVRTTHGRPVQAPFLSDVEATSDAQIIAEGVQDTTQTPPANLSGTYLSAYSFRTPYWAISLEALQDMETAFPALELFKAFQAARVARGVGKKLVRGDGNVSGDKITGLVTALNRLGVLPVVAQGAHAGQFPNVNDATRNSGNSIGSQDLANLFYSVAAPYRNSPKCCWIMNDATLQYLTGMASNSGQPLVNVVGGLEGDSVRGATLFGKPVRISPSMDVIAPNSIPIAFGDFKFWCTRSAEDGSMINLYRQLPGLIENGAVALQLRCRYDGKLLFNDPGELSSPAALSSPPTNENASPIRLLKMGSGS